MVNTGFHLPAHGFELVDLPAGTIRGVSVNRKFTTSSISKNFASIFRELISRQSLAIYRELLGRNARGRSPRAGPTIQVDTMRFLLRITFWLGLVLVLLPRDKTPESEKLPPIGAADAVQAATAAVSDMTQFCNRQPTACEVGGHAASIIGQRAQDGAKKLYQIINDKKEQITKDKNEKNDKKAPDHTGSIAMAGEGDAIPGEAPHDTLSQDDLALEWRGPQPAN
jgi:hypothetical protein